MASPLLWPTPLRLCDNTATIRRQYGDNTATTCPRHALRILICRIREQCIKEDLSKILSFGAITRAREGADQLGVINILNKDRTNGRDQ
jgi:hypothetical protein